MVIIPAGKAPYKRGYHKTKSKGQTTNILCSLCGKRVPRYKTFVKSRGFRITDPGILRSVNRRQIHTFQRKQYLCPACARFHGVVQKKNR